MALTLHLATECMSVYTRITTMGSSLGKLLFKGIYVFCHYWFFVLFFLFKLKTESHYVAWNS